MIYCGDVDDINNRCVECDKLSGGYGIELWCDCYCPDFFNPLCHVCGSCEFKIQCERDFFNECCI